MPAPDETVEAPRRTTKKAAAKAPPAPEPPAGPFTAEQRTRVEALDVAVNTLERVASETVTAAALLDVAAWVIDGTRVLELAATTYDDEGDSLTFTGPPTTGNTDTSKENHQ